MPYTTVLSQIGAAIAVILGVWLVLQVSKKILRVWTFLFYTFLGGVAVAAISFWKLGTVPNSAVWASSAVAFGWSAVLIRRRILKIVSIVAILGASYLLFGYIF